MAKPCPDHGREGTYKPDKHSRRVRCALCGWTWGPEDAKPRADGHESVPSRHPQSKCGDVMHADRPTWPDGGPWANIGTKADGGVCSLAPTRVEPVGGGVAVAFCTRHYKSHVGDD